MVTFMTARDNPINNPLKRPYCVEPLKNPSPRKVLHLFVSVARYVVGLVGEQQVIQDLRNSKS